MMSKDSSTEIPPTYVDSCSIKEEKGYTRADWIYKPPAGWRPTGATPEGLVTPSPVLKRVTTDDNLSGLESAAKAADDRILQVRLLLPIVNITARISGSI